MNSFLKLVRWPNLLIVIVSMVFTLMFVIDPLLGVDSFVIGFTGSEFSLLILSTLFITIGGYLINDIFDLDADRINKPGKNVVGGKWPVFTVQVMYWVFTLAGVALGVFLSWKLDKLNFSLVFVFVAGLLWFYSERYKCIPIVGNLVVAFLSALSFGLVWLFYFFALSGDALAFSAVQANFEVVTNFVLIYAGFAFVTSFLREVIKDIEDMEGDERYGCNTFVVAFGKTKAKILAVTIALSGLILTILVQVYFYNYDFMILLGYFAILDLAFMLCILWITTATTKIHFKKLSNFVKLLMIVGIGSMLFVYFEVLLQMAG